MSGVEVVPHLLESTTRFHPCHQQSTSINRNDLRFKWWVTGIMHSFYNFWKLKKSFIKAKLVFQKYIFHSALQVVLEWKCKTKVIEWAFQQYPDVSLPASHPNLKVVEIWIYLEIKRKKSALQEVDEIIFVHLFWM